MANPETSRSVEKRGIKLGFDNYSIRALGWKAPQLIEYAAAQKLDTILLSDLEVYESRDEKYLRELKARADALGLEIHAGTGGICPTSGRFDARYGTAEEHLRLAIRIARALGSPVVRCFLGSVDDRKGPEGIYRHIRAATQVLKNVRGAALEAGVKIAVENHSGDMQSWELVELIEKAGKDFVGATMDSGNAACALEDPLRSLEILGPYALSTGIRDSMIWECEEGAMVQWTAMGEGCVDLQAYFDRYARLCPRTPVVLEIISGSARSFPYLKKEFWSAYPKARAGDFAAFLALARRGKPLEPFPADQKAELERSIGYCKEVLGLGLKN